MNKKLIRLTEQDLHNIVKESVNMVLNEIHFNAKDYSRRNTKNKLSEPPFDLDKEKFDVAKLARDFFPDHTPQTAKDELLRIVHGRYKI